MKAGIGAFGGILSVGYIGLIGKYLAPPVAGSEPLVNVGKVSDFNLNVPKLISYQNGGIEQGVYVINTGDEGWLALDFHCTHLQCAVNWLDATQTFVCPCHGGIYDLKGNVKGGPPPKPLQRRVIQIQGDAVMVGGRVV